MAHFSKILFGVLLAGLGLLAGRMLASAPTPEKEPVHAAHDGPCTHGAEAAAAPDVIPSRTLKSMGVEIGSADRGTFVLTRSVQAVVVNRPLNQRPVVAPLGGLVTEVSTQTGAVVRAGDVLITIARDPIPRPKPELTADLLKPVSVAVHETAARLRLAASEIKVTKQELDRIAPFIENRTIPGKTAIELRYQLARSEQEFVNATMELKTHGMTQAEVDAVAGGARPPRTPSLWRRSLEENGLWTTNSQALWTLLPEAQRGLPWCVAAVGELTAAGLVSPELTAFVRAEESAPQRFAEIAGLLLAGTPLATVELLLERGALEPVTRILAPRIDAGRWDVEEILVRPGQRVEAGEIAVRLYDARVMWLELRPIGQELGIVSRAIEAGEPVRAVPLIDGSGPVLEDVRLQRLALQGTSDSRGGLAHALVENLALACAPGVPCRTWQLRVGLRYLVEVPLERWERRFVLPSDAVTMNGPDRVVFIQDGDTFRPQIVHVEYRDDKVVVIADDGSIYQDDPVVMSGAFALGLALEIDTSDGAASEHGHAHQ